MTLHHSLRAAAGNVESGIVTSNLVLHLDAADTNSYSGSGTTWADLSGNGNDFTLANANQFTTDTNGYKNMLTTAATIEYSGTGDVGTAAKTTAMVFTIPISNNNWMALFKSVAGPAGGSTSTNGFYPVISLDSFYNDYLGLYSFGTSGGLKQSTGEFSDPPNYSTKYNAFVFKFDSSTSPYWSFQYNDDTTVHTISLSNIAYSGGIRFIGNGSTGGLGWGRIAVVLFYTKHLTQAEIDQNYNFYKARFGI